MKPSATRRTRRPSPQHDAVLAVLRTARRPLSASELQQRAQRCCSHIGIATVYRVLHMLAAGAQVRQICVPNGSVYYERCGPTPHDHLYCTRCKHVHCLAPCRVILRGSEARQVRVTGRALLLYGTCAACTSAGQRCRDR